MDRRKMAPWRILGLAALPAFILGGCESTPAGGEGVDSPLIQALQEVVLQEWAQLPMEEELESQARDAAGASNSWSALWSGVLAGEGQLAGVQGQGRSALQLQGEGRRLVAGAAVEAFGPAWAAGVVAGVAAALSAVEGVAGGKRLPAQEEALFGQARAAMASAGRSGDESEALAGTLKTSEALRMFAPEAAASAAIRVATRLLDRARQAARGTSRFDEALARSADHLAAAEAAYDAGRWRAAVAEARSSSALSRRVLGAMGMGEPPVTTAEAAQRALEMATGLYVEAEAAVSGGTELQLRLLAEARALLSQAQDEYSAGDYGDAIRLAVRSAAISRRLIHAATPPAATAAAAARAIRVATELHQAVGEKLAGGGTTAQKEAFARAGRLLEAAGEALEAGHHPRAIRLAVEASVLSRRLLLALG